MQLGDRLKVKLKVSGDDESSDIEFNGDPIIYASKTKDKLKQLLVLYNIEYIIQKNKDADHGYILFPFDLFKSEKWDIEHVDSFTTNPLTEREQQKEWLKTALDDLKEYGIVYSEKEKISKSEADKIDGFLKDPETNVTFDEIKRIISKLAGEYLPTEEVKRDVKNTIGNLTLLNVDINRGYGNSIFPSKKTDHKKGCRRPLYSDLYKECVFEEFYWRKQYFYILERNRYEAIQKKHYRCS